jgi:hypothetical protein
MRQPPHPAKKKGENPSETGRGLRGKKVIHRGNWMCLRCGRRGLSPEHTCYDGWKLTQLGLAQAASQTASTYPHNLRDYFTLALRTKYAVLLVRQTGVKEAESKK